MAITILDSVLLNLVCFCGGVLSSFLFVFCCEPRRFRIIAKHNYLDGAMNHQQVISPVLTALPTAPTIIDNYQLK